MVFTQEEWDNFPFLGEEKKKKKGEQLKTGIVFVKMAKTSLMHFIQSH